MCPKTEPWGKPHRIGMLLDADWPTNTFFGKVQININHSKTEHKNPNVRFKRFSRIE